MAKKSKWMGYKFWWFQLNGIEWKSIGLLYFIYWAIIFLFTYYSLANLSIIVINIESLILKFNKIWCKLWQKSLNELATSFDDFN
jgi:hypothetical protein